MPKGVGYEVMICANGEVRYQQLVPRDKLALRIERPLTNALAALCRDLEAGK